MRQPPSIRIAQAIGLITAYRNGVSEFADYLENQLGPDPIPTPVLACIDALATAFSLSLDRLSMETGKEVIDLINAMGLAAVLIRESDTDQ